MSDTPTGGPDGHQDGPTSDPVGGPPDHRKAKSLLRRRRAARRVVVGAHAAGAPSAASPAVESQPARDVAEPDETAHEETAHATLPDAPAEPGDHPTIGGEGQPSDGPATGDDAAGAGDQVPEAPGGRTLPGPAVLVVAAVLLVALVTTGVLAWKVLQAGAVQEAEEAALAVGSRHVEGVLSFDYRNLDKAAARAEQALTPDYLEEYRKTTQAEVEPTARELRAVVRANVVEAAVVSSSTDRVSLLMFVNRQVTREGLSGPKIDLERVRVTMTPVDEEWRIAKVDLL